MTQEKKETLSGEDVVERVKRLIHEGNVRRVIVKNDDRTIAEFPLTVGVGVGVGVAVFAPILAAIGAIAALVTNCSIIVEKTEGGSGGDADKPQT